MCDLVNDVIDNSKKSDKPWVPLYDYLIKQCNCDHCQNNYKKIDAIFKIRISFRKKLKTLNKKPRNLKSKSIGEREYDHLHKHWMLPLYDNINDIHLYLQ